MAILKFRVYWEDDESVYRDLVVKHTQTFLQLHETILTCFEFDKKHHATFFKSNDNWQRGREISLEKYDKVYKAEPLIMAECTVGSEIKDPNQKFIYVYDFHKNWTFMVELINVNKEESIKITYPGCIRTEGIGPSQYGTKGLINEKLAEIEEKYDLNTAVLADVYSEEGEEDTETEKEENESENENETDDL
ncbi:MAG: hypothetical protein ABIP35_02550 [Ginsengibacter sp.]